MVAVLVTDRLRAEVESTMPRTILDPGETGVREYKESGAW